MKFYNFFQATDCSYESLSSMIFQNTLIIRILPHSGNSVGTAQFMFLEYQCSTSPGSQEPQLDPRWVVILFIKILAWNNTAFTCFQKAMYIIISDKQLYLLSVSIFMLFACNVRTFYMFL